MIAKAKTDKGMEHMEISLRLDGVTRERDSLMAQLNELNRKCKDLEQQVALLKEDSSNSILTLKVEIERLKQEIEGLNSELDAAPGGCCTPSGKVKRPSK